jgi:hypothetical protein
MVRDVVGGLGVLGDSDRRGWGRLDAGNIRRLLRAVATSDTDDDAHDGHNSEATREWAPAEPQFGGTRRRLCLIHSKLPIIWIRQRGT